MAAACPPVWQAFFDTGDVEWLKLSVDWSRALGNGMERFILKNDDDGGADEDGDGVADEVDEVREVLWKHVTLYFCLFDHYASLGGDSLQTVSLNEWNRFVEDCRLANQKSKYCKRADLDRLFIAVDAASSGGRRDKALQRPEFLQCLVRLAVLRYVLPGSILDVSHAFGELCVGDVLPSIHAAVRSPPDDFRRRHLYTEAVDRVLRKHEGTLRALFSVVGQYGGQRPAVKALGLLISLSDWRLLTRRLELIDSDLTERDATVSAAAKREPSLPSSPPPPPPRRQPSSVTSCHAAFARGLLMPCNNLVPDPLFCARALAYIRLWQLCFVASRMAVIDGTTDTGTLKENQLPFEGFMVRARLPCRHTHTEYPQNMRPHRTCGSSENMLPRKRLA